MDLMEVDGLVIREAKFGEADEMITLLTADRGKLSVSGKDVRRLNNRNAATSQLFTYATFSLRKPKQCYYINDSTYIENFMGIRFDVERLALATYLCAIADDLAMPDVADPELMQMTLNALYALSDRDDIPPERVKAAYEFRAICHAGFQPDLLLCAGCHAGKVEEPMYLDVMNGRLFCKECQEAYVHSADYAMDDTTAKIHIRISPSVRRAMYYIAVAPVKKLFSFRVTEAEDKTVLGIACERYLLNHLEHSFPSLDFYKKVKDPIDIRPTKGRNESQ